MNLSFNKSILKSTPASLIINLLWLYICYEVCRLAFLFENWDLYSTTLTWQSFRHISIGGLKFDTSAIFYTNGLYILLLLLPFHHKEVKWYRELTKWVYVTVNSICIIINLCDTVFFPFRMQRSSIATIQEFQGEGNLMTIFFEEFFSHWYFVLLAALMIWFLIRCYRYPAPPQKPLWRYYVSQSVTLLIMVPITIFGIRGNTFFSATRPISVGYAQRFANQPIETGIVLNTTFSLIRTIGEVPMRTPEYFSDQAELDAIYSPLHTPADSITPRKKNVVILIVESFAQEFVGALNKNLDGDTYKGYTPFADSLLTQSLSFEQTFDNTGFSIDAPPAVFASIPRMDRPFVVSPHSLNHINSLATELKNLGYYSEFFHGADNESLGFHAFTKGAGFDAYSGQDEFYADPRFGGKSQFDGTWGVWDEPFLQFFCAKISEMPQPFLASVFTLSSHHPFALPEQYRDTFPDEGLHKLHKCIRYTDHSLRRFFESASKQPWYNNTIFVLTADHASSKRTHDEYKTELGGCRIPILFFDPSGEMPRGQRQGIAQQIDIMPTLLNYLGYDRPYIAFGKDLLNTPTDQTWAVNWNRFPMYIKGDYVLFFDGNETTAMYNYRQDPLLKNNLKGTKSKEQTDMELHLKAFIQSYMQRMNSDNVRIPSTH